MTPPLDDFDFGGDPEGAEPTILKAVREYELTPYDPGRDRERVRGRVAVALVALFAVLVVSPLIGVFAGADVANLKAITEIVLAPTVALCGTAVGFYYGSGPSS